MEWDFENIYNTLYLNRHNLVGHTLNDIKQDYDNYNPRDVGSAFYKLVEEEIIEVEKDSEGNKMIISVIK